MNVNKHLIKKLMICAAILLGVCLLGTQECQAFSPLTHGVSAELGANKLNLIDPQLRSAFISGAIFADFGRFDLDQYVKNILGRNCDSDSDQVAKMMFETATTEDKFATNSMTLWFALGWLEHVRQDSVGNVKNVFPSETYLEGCYLIDYALAHGFVGTDDKLCQMLSENPLYNKTRDFSLFIPADLIQETYKKLGVEISEPQVYGECAKIMLLENVVPVGNAPKQLGQVDISQKISIELHRVADSLNMSYFTDYPREILEEDEQKIVQTAEIEFIGDSKFTQAIHWAYSFSKSFCLRVDASERVQLVKNSSFSWVCQIAADKLRSGFKI